MFFQPNENVTAFYKNKLSQLEYQHLDQIPPVTPGGMDSPGVDFKLPRDEDKVKKWDGWDSPGVCWLKCSFGLGLYEAATYH